jgi:hypothetical protein
MRFQLLTLIVLGIRKPSWDFIVDIFTIVTPILIAFFGYRTSKKQDEKILKDNEINRKANFQSSLILSDKMEILIYMDSLHNYSEYEKDQNVLLSRKDLVNGMCYAFNLDLYLENLTNIFPSSAIIYEVELYDNSPNSKDLRGNFINYTFLNRNRIFKRTTIDKNKNTCISILCCVSYGEMNILKQYNDLDRILSIVIKLAIKNTCGIITNCMVKGTFKIVNFIDLISGAAGGSKKKWELKVEKAYLEIESIEEE